MTRTNKLLLGGAVLVVFTGIIIGNLRFDPATVPAPRPAFQSQKFAPRLTGADLQYAQAQEARRIKSEWGHVFTSTSVVRNSLMLHDDSYPNVTPNDARSFICDKSLVESQKALDQSLFEEVYFFSPDGNRFVIALPVPCKQ